MESLWADEFDGEGAAAPDDRYWTFELGDGSQLGIPGWGNAERQFYVADAARTDGLSMLAIRASRVAASPPGIPTSSASYACYYGAAAEWTSARLTTKEKVSFQYGRIEVRARFPFGLGTWPAIWLLGCSIDHEPWPLCGEIDIAEGRGRDPHTVFGTVHGPGYSGDGGIAHEHDLTAPVAADFHTFGIDWLPGHISWHLDGEVYASLHRDELRGQSWVFDQPFYLLLNLAMGGNFAGPIADEVNAATMHVDFVRHSSIDGIGQVRFADRLSV